MNRKSEKSDFMIPLNSATCGHLVFLSDVAGLTILTDASISELTRGSFEQLPARVWVEENTIMIQCRDLSSHRVRDHLQNQLGVITLNPSIPWEIEFRGQTSNLTGDLRGLELRSLDMLGGVNQVELLVTNPIKTSFIYITGGIADSAIHVSTRVGMHVQVNGHVKDLFFDSQHFDALNGKTNLENAVFNSTSSRYDICITGGASHLTIDG